MVDWYIDGSFSGDAVVSSILVLPLGLLGQHLLHAERRQTDSEGS